MPESLQRVQELAGRPLEFEEMDILDQAALERLFKKVGGLQAGRQRALPRAGACKAASDPGSVPAAQLYGSHPLCWAQGCGRVSAEASGLLQS